MARTPVMTVESLARLGADRLAALVICEAGRNAPFKKIVAAALAGTKGPEAVAGPIDRRLAALERARGVVDWQKRKAFAADLAATVATITDELGTLDPASAIDRLLRFLQGAEAVLDRVDDATGSVAAVYDAAVRGVPQIAARLSEDERVGLAERLAGLLGGDGLVASAFAACVDLLPRERLGAVDAALTAALKAARGSKTGMAAWEARARHERIVAARKAVADRAGDVDAFIALETRRSGGGPDTLAIAERLLASGRVPEALDWVRRRSGRDRDYASSGDLADGAPVRDPAAENRVALEVRILDALGERDAAQALRWSAFDTSLDAAVLRDIVAHCPDFGEFEALDRAFAHAAAVPDRHAALSLFVAWPRLDLAAKLVLDHRTTWEGRRYGVLVPAVEGLAPDHPAAATVLYRALVDDILTRSRSPAYGHAARHFAVLGDLAADADGDAGLVPHAVYRDGLKRAHGRKAAFWSLVADR